MAKFGKRFALVLCLLALCVGMVSVTAFAAYEPVTATIPVEIILSGGVPEQPDTFTVELTADDPSFPMPEGAADGVATVDIKGAGSDSFVITYDDLGVYTYTVKQLSVDNEDCYQQLHTYQVIAQVVNKEDFSGFDLVVVIYKDGETEKCDSIVYENRYAMPGSVQIAATKTMDGKTPKAGAFQFELVDVEGNVIQTLTNNDKGEINFDPIVCDQIGTWVYSIREVPGNDTGIIYDKTVYAVVVDVEKDDNGDYVGTVTYKLNNKDLEKVPNFANETKPVTPETGDNANMLLWGGIMVAALIGIVVLLLAMKKKPGKAA